MPEFKNAEKWMETGYQILSEEVQNQIMSDGWHKEMSLHYHIGIVADFYEAMKLAEANQLPVNCLVILQNRFAKQLK